MSASYGEESKTHTHKRCITDLAKRTAVLHNDAVEAIAVLSMKYEVNVFDRLAGVWTTPRARLFWLPFYSVCWLFACMFVSLLASCFILWSSRIVVISVEISGNWKRTTTIEKQWPLKFRTKICCSSRCRCLYYRRRTKTDKNNDDKDDDTSTVVVLAMVVVEVVCFIRYIDFPRESDVIYLCSVFLCRTSCGRRRVRL